MTKLDEMIEADLKEYYLNPEGDYVANFAELLPDYYAMNPERWHKSIESAVNPVHYVTGEGTQPIYDQIEVLYALSRSRPKDFASYDIGELAIQLPEDLDSYESDEYHITESCGTHYAYVNTDEVITFVLDRDQIIEFLDEQSEAA